MGLFQHRPEEPTEWGGLPSEPWKADGIDERLDDPPLASTASLPRADAITTIEIPLEGFAGDTPTNQPDEREAEGDTSE